jgi:hypothetical protein
LPQSESPQPALSQPELPQGDSSPVGVRSLLGSVATQEDAPRRPRVAMAVGMVGLIIGSAVGGYVWFRPASQTPTNLASTDHTEQVVDAAPSAGAASRPQGDRLWTIVADATRDTTDAEAILGKPNGHSAAIGPGGALAIAHDGDRPFYNGEGADVRLDGPSAKPTPYTIFARAGSQEPWLRFDVNRKGFPNGFAQHDFGHHQLEQARQLLIRNDGRMTLYVDAVTPLHTEPEAPEAHDASHGPGGDAH